MLGGVDVLRGQVSPLDHRWLADVETPQVRVGLGLVPFSIDPHYDSTHDKELFTLSEGRS